MRVDSSGGDGRSRHHEEWREAVTMALYVSIVLLAALAALPAGGGHGVHGAALVGLVWGTALGLALAHWFAFRISASLFGGGAVSEQDVAIGLAQVTGAAAVALACTVPIVLADDGAEVSASSFVPATIIGVAGYATARVGGRSRAASVLVGAVTLILGLLVAATKNWLAGH